MMDAKNESVILPLVGRNVQTHDDASDAFNIEGADFLNLTVDSGRSPDQLVSSVYGIVKIPIFVMVDSFGYGTSYMKDSDLLRSGANGVVVSVDELNLFKEDDLSKHFLSDMHQERMSRWRLEVKALMSSKVWIWRVACLGGRRLRALQYWKRERENERSILLEAIDVIQRAAPLVVI